MNNPTNPGWIQAVNWRTICVALSPLAIYLTQNYVIAPLNGHGLVGTIAAGAVVFVGDAVLRELGAGKT